MGLCFNTASVWCQWITFDCYVPVFWSDVWSLGCVLYELCTLQHPVCLHPSSLTGQRKASLQTLFEHSGDLNNTLLHCHQIGNVPTSPMCLCCRWSSQNWETSIFYLLPLWIISESIYLRGFFLHYYSCNHDTSKSRMKNDHPIIDNNKLLDIASFLVQLDPCTFSLPSSSRHRAGRTWS